MNRPLNILRVITWLPIGGIERRLVALLPRLDREKFNVRVVCIRERGPLADDLEARGIPVDVVPFASRWDPAAVLALRRHILRHTVDLIHSHMYRANVPATVAGRLAGVRRIWAQIHNVDSWDTPRQAMIDRRLAPLRSGTIAVSERVRYDIVRTLRVPAERVRVIYNGVEIERFARARAQRDEMRRKMCVEPSHTVYIFAHRLVEQKRCADFIEAFGRLQREAGGDALRAWIVGDGGLNRELRQQATQLPRPGAIHFFGQRDNVEDYLAGADVYVLPSSKEGFSNGLVEALAAGLPCVATDVGGNAEAVLDNVHGLIVPPREVNLLTAAMKTLWHDRDARARMSVAAADRAELFSLARMVDEVERLYLESCDPGDPGK